MYEFKKQEERILKLWKQKKIYSKSKKKNAKGKKFYMMDGPPYATGHIHMGTALNKILKDIAMRVKRMQNFNVFDRAGYDTHGVPIEFQIEKEIGSKSKKDIEKYGVKKFINKCKEFATRYIGVMNSEFGNLGVWMDFENPYLTLNNKYIETIWDTFKEADKKGLLYLGKYPIHICPRCETAVAYNEIEYAKQEDNSIIVKFPVKNEKKKYLLIWTTTPWTLPGNTGVMVNPNFDYAEIELDNKEIWIIAKDLIRKIMDQFSHKYNIKKIFKGKELKGLEYINPLVKNLKLKLKNAYKVVLSSRYVNLEEGTGLVHCAPGHGKEDYEVGKENNLDMPSPVGIDGLLTQEAGKYAGKKARIVDEEIIRDLDDEGMLAHKEIYSHDYPLCWRCKSSLLMIALPQWFLKISKIHKNILKENEKTNWVPSWMKLRMKAWLEGISDWPISRKRYWGTPLPIWVCEKCKERKIIGNIKELEKLSRRKIKEIHKPEIDNIKLKCKCGGEMKRVDEVLDVWFDSGVSSWAALDYLNNEKQFKKFWPADLNLEGKDQVRGWWNSQLILSEIKFEKKPFDSILVHGLVLDLGKRKMSKSLGNIVSPKDVIDKFGRDFLRYYFAKISKGEDFAFDEKEFNDIQNLFRVLVNINNFVNQIGKKKSRIEIEDKWILSRLNYTIKESVEKYNSYKYDDAVQILEKFLIFDLSKTYIQIIRERADETYDILNKIRKEILKLLSPIIPFITESIWQELRNKKIVKSQNLKNSDDCQKSKRFLKEESIHLSEFPKADTKKINKKLEEKMGIVLRIIEIGLAERDKAEIGLKWPLANAKIESKEKIDKNLQEIIKRQLNVKKIEIKKGKEMKVELDTIITPELEAEGFAREISRKIQAERKKAGLVKKDKIKVIIITEKIMSERLKNHEKFLKERVNAEKLMLTSESKERFKNSFEFKIKEVKVFVTFTEV